jgi:ABC-type sugar transport system ATPase subunit
MTGVHQPDAGTVLLEGQPVTLRSTQEAQEAGIAAIYQEPMVFPDLDVAENIFISNRGKGAVMRWGELYREADAIVAQLGVTLDVRRAASGLTLAEQQTVEIARAPSLKVKVLIMDEPTASLGKLLRTLGLIDRRAEFAMAERYRQQLAIKAADVRIEVGRLSGGNQQKVMLAKWLETKPRVLIFDEPTRGIDVGAKAEVHNIIRQLAKDGVAVIVISSDLPEVLALADRVLVMREGRQAGILGIDQASQERVIGLAAGQGERSAA